jgi:hypothetical protein
LNRLRARKSLGCWRLSGLHRQEDIFEGAVIVMGDDVLKKADKFGLSVDVVAAHIATHCYEHPTETAFDAVQHLLVKVPK